MPVLQRDWPQLAGFVAFILLTGTIGIAFGALLHNTAVAIVTYFALGGALSLLMIPALQAAGAGSTQSRPTAGSYTTSGPVTAPRSRLPPCCGSPCP
jgi:hypothetical protein